jgi:glycosyltransferase involved in cell wall biosynthesis
MVKCLTMFSNFPKHANDSGDWIGDFIEILKGKGIKVLVLTPHTSGTLSHEERDGVVISRFKYFYPTKFQNLAYGGGMPYNFKRSTLAKFQLPLFVLSELYHTLKIVYFEHVDVVNSHWLIPQGFVGAICKKAFKISHIATLHSSEVTLLRKMPFGGTIAQFIAANSDCIVSVSKHRADEFVSLMTPKFREKCRQKTLIVPMGINSRISQTQVDAKDLRRKYHINSKYVVLFVGRLVEVKGCEYLIESFKKVIKHQNDTLLLIVGRGPLEGDLKKTVLENNLNLCVRFEGFVEHDKIWDYYNLADIVVIPSIVDSSGYEEGLPVTLLEALAAGKALIGTNTNGICEVIRNGENGLLVNQKNPEQLADKIIGLLNNDSLRDSLSQNALVCARNYDWDLIGEKYAAVIRRLTSSEMDTKED